MILSLFSCSKSNCQFDKIRFQRAKYTKSQIMLFCDIGFRESNIIRKWDTDINVEINNIDSMDVMHIADVDSCIAILSPLIKPLKIRRVKSGGNLKIFYVNKMPLQMGMGMGYCKLNNSWFSSSINNVELDILKIMPPPEASILLHEFEHALGLAHPKRKHYPFILNICSPQAPAIITMDELDAYLDNRYPISEQEKEVIKMLYSGVFASGFDRRSYMKEMNIKDEGIWK